MKHIAHHNAPHRLWVGALALGMLAVPWAMAQGVYRIVGPDGRVTYSDQPPPPSANAKPVTGTSSAGAASAPLPSELRQAVGRYPVTLYTSNDCSPCNSGRNMLNARGIPYTEKTVTTADDSAALKRLSGATAIPLLTIGGQQIKGYSDTEWNQYLDAAGYPKRSVLPASYRRAAATPLVETAPVAAAPAATKEAAANRDRPAEPTETPVTAPAANPGGIRF
jgi:glutaredoxin